MDNNFKMIEKMLFDYKYFKIYVDDKERLKEDIKNKVPGAIRAICTDGISISPTNSIHSIVEGDVVRKVDSLIEIDILTYPNKRKIRIIEKTLEEMQPIYKELFQFKYVKELSPSQIAQEMHVSEKTVYNLRDKLVKAMEIAWFGENNGRE